jgi:nucleotide-binding universal stress UspA family protein
LAASRILIAVSSPWASEKLADTVRDLAQRLKASVVVAHVAQPLDSDDSEDDMRQRGEQTISTLTTRLIESNITAESILLFGDDVGRAVLNAARDQKATIIVLGASGKGRMARLLAGDVPKQVIDNAEVPVLVYPPEWKGTI